MAEKTLLNQLNALLKRYFEGGLNNTSLVDPFNSRVQGLQHILLTDRDGVTLLNASDPNSPSPISVPTLCATFSLANFQIEKLGLGKGQSWRVELKEHTIIHFNFSPLILTFITCRSANLGLCITLGRELKKDVDDLGKIFMDKKLKSGLVMVSSGANANLETSAPPT